MNGGVSHNVVLTGRQQRREQDSHAENLQKAEEGDESDSMILQGVLPVEWTSYLQM